MERPEIEEWIAVERDSWKSIMNGVASGAWLMHEFLLRNGKRFVSQPKPKRYKMGIPKACFENTRALVSRSRGRLRYAEGYVASAELPLLILHAWAVDSKDRVIDTTLQDILTRESRSAEAQYFGIVFPKEIWPKWGGLSVLDSDRGYRIPLWLTVDSGFREFLPKEFSLARAV
jgi:hypothetical protein